jgi:putative aldouronate transport system permease protein
MKDRSWGSTIFDGVNILLLLIAALMAIIPFIYVISVSFATPQEVLRKGFVLFPTTFSLEGYRYIFSSTIIVSSLFVTIGLTVVGTLCNLFFTVLMAYPLAKRNLDGRKIILWMCVFTMIFNGGMIPTFLVVKAFGMLNSYASLIVPGLISAFNLVVIMNFFQQLPDGLEEAGEIDGCSHVGILFRIVLPLSMPVIATFSLFYAVGHWNSFFNAILYINDAHKWPIQVWLRQIVILAQGGIGDSTQFDETYIAPPPEIIKMAVIVVSTVPILLVYPFLQKHFAKGVLLGSVKG